MKKKIDCIMLVDDDFGTNLFHKIIIEEGDYTNKIVVVTNGEEALDYLKKPKDEENPTPNIIFLDINMPRMNGWEFLVEYEKLNPVQQADTTIVILSTSSNPEDIRKAKNNPLVQGYKSKPLTDEILQEIIGTILVEK